MKRNVTNTMDQLMIDPNIRFLVEKLWKHGYRTLHSCEGHDERKLGGSGISKAYITFREGDGWFEKNAHLFGLSKLKEKECCETSRGPRYCNHCGSGKGDIEAYKGGVFNPNPFQKI